MVELEMAWQIFYRSNKSLFGLLSTVNVFSNAHYMVRGVKKKSLLVLQRFPI